MKTPLSLEQLDAQQAFELPNRELPLVTIVVTNLLNNNTVDVTVANNDVALQVCAQLISTGRLACEIQQ